MGGHSPSAIAARLADTRKPERLVQKPVSTGKGGQKAVTYSVKSIMSLFNTGSAAIATIVKGEVVSPMAILVKWNLLRACGEGDGMVVKYRVYYTAESSGEVQSIDQPGELSITRVEASLTGLTPYTNYSIQITTVNEHGVVGLYSYPITIQTPEDGIK